MADRRPWGRAREHGAAFEEGPDAAGGAEGQTRARPCGGQPTGSPHRRGAATEANEDGVEGPSCSVQVMWTQEYYSLRSLFFVENTVMRLNMIYKFTDNSSLYEMVGNS